jgi:hypothetical protein
MGERNRINDQFVVKLLQEKNIRNNTLKQFIKKRNHTSAQFVISFPRRGNLKQHIQTVGDGSHKNTRNSDISELVKFYQLKNKCSLNSVDPKNLPGCPKAESRCKMI